MNVKVLSFLFFFSVVSYLFFPYYDSKFDAATESESDNPPPLTHPPPAIRSGDGEPKCDPEIALFYMYDLPEKFNSGLLRNCTDIDKYKDMCTYFENQAMGRAFANKPGWYNTYQFTADMLFYARAAQHPCRTRDLSAAALFYVPFYASLYTHVFFHGEGIARRDALGIELVEFISSQPSFQKYGGKDHFLPCGLMAWDLMRNPEITDPKSSRANIFLNLPEISNVSVLVIERNTYNGKNQFGIPYPSYFHPKSKSEIIEWQDEMRRSERTHLFSFVGGGRMKGHGSAKYRSAAIEQCNRTANCILVLCKYWIVTWDAADEILGAMKKARFCLQPPGDTMTRRSIFDSILAGCIPVFFSELTAYEQYNWYIPERRGDWSVLIGPDQMDRIEEVLMGIEEKDVKRMTEVVVGMIPYVTYMHPNASWMEPGPRDAVDTALVELTKRVKQLKSNL